MIKNGIELNNFLKDLAEKENIPYKKALCVYEELHKEAVSLGIINSKNILEGLEIDLKISRVINGLRR